MDSINTKLSFVELGKFLSQFRLDKQSQCDNVLYNDLFFDKFKNLIQLSQSHNGWFTPVQVHYAIQSWSEALKEDNLDKWLHPYSIDCGQN
jgi:hypothetical protein